MKLKAAILILGSAALIGACSDEPKANGTEDSQQVEMEAPVMIDYAAILAAPDRSEADKERDASRHPAEVLALMKVQPGQMILDVGAGSGYYSEVFARAVGPTGMVHAINDPGTIEKFPQVETNLAARAENLKEGHIYPEVTPYTEITAHKPADAVFLGQMYHELIRQGVDELAFNTAIYNALRPGGLYVIEIHNAKPGAGPGVSDSLHRADPQIVKKMVLAAGFKMVDENTTLLGNPEDPKDIMVFDPSIRYHTDRTLFIFRKP